MARIVSFADGTRNAKMVGVFRAVRALNRARSLTGHERDREDEKQRTTARTTRCGDHGRLKVIADSPAGESNTGLRAEDDTMLTLRLAIC